MQTDNDLLPPLTNSNTMTKSGQTTTSDDDDSNQVLLLEPLIHQVGGHSSLFCLDSGGTICKRYVKEELEVYLTLPDDVRCFVPEYRGIIELDFGDLHKSSLLSLTSFSPAPPQPVSKQQQHSAKPLHRNSSFRKFKDRSKATPTRVRLKRNSSCEALSYSSSNSGPRSVTDKIENGISSSESAGSSSCESECISTASSTASAPPVVASHLQSTSVATTATLVKRHPWSVRCHTVEMERLKSFEGGNRQSFVLLENLAFQFESPCILDVKMGTQQHGDNATEHKRKGQSAKCQKSTSSSLGVRVCGMQVFQVKSKLYKCVDKYYGRNLDEKGFRDSLFQFLDNGVSVRIGVIKAFLNKLHALRKVLESADSFRFYGASLLLLYEGAIGGGRSSGSNCEHCHSTSPSSECPTTTTATGVRDDLPGECKAKPSDFQCMSRTLTSDQASTGPIGSTRSMIDVRMVDFAHTTYRGFKHATQLHTGPDEGYLLGLQTLISMFKDIEINPPNDDGSSG